MRNPLRSEAEAYRFLWIVIVGAAVIIVAAFINTWLGVAVAVIAFAALGWWLMQEPVPGAAEPPPVVASGTPPGTPPRARRRAARHARRVDVPRRRRRARRRAGARLDGRVADRSRGRPARASRGDGRRARGARCPGVAGARSAPTTRRSRSRTRCACSAPTRSLVVGDDGMVEAIRERVALPVSRA